LDFNAAFIKRRLVEKIGPALTDSNVPAGLAPATIDLVPLLSIADDASFVRESYLRVLGRECDVGGFVHYRELLRGGYPRRAVLWQLVESAEAKAAGRRYSGLTTAGVESRGWLGLSRIAGFRVSLWNRARRLFECFLRVARVEAIELKLDYLLQENAVQAERGMAKVDHALFAISDKMDRYVADLMAKQGELAGLARENRTGLAALALENQTGLAALARENQTGLAALGRENQTGQAAVAKEMEAQERTLAELREAVRSSAEDLERLRESQKMELGALQALVGEIRLRQRAPVFQAGSEVVVTEVDGFLLGIPGREWRLAAYYGLRGLPEPGVMRLFRSLVKPGMVVVDIGAHLGIYTLNALRELAGHGRVYCFEPTPKTFALLRDNVQVNGFLESGMVHFDQRAVSDRTGRVEFTVYAGNSGHNTLFAGQTTGETMLVETVSLDEALEAEAAVALVKIDAEGAEPFILRGMIQILARSPEIRILLEFGPAHLRRARIEPLQWLEELASLGLAVLRIDDLSGEALAFDRGAAADCVNWNLLLRRC
jgi:FkbM family methyltransferase